MGSSFATTRWSQVLAAGSGDQAAASAALAWLCERQWEPLRRAARRWGVPADRAEDVVQDFCCRLIERRADLGALDPAAGRFRAWLITVFRRFIKDQRVRDRALVHGGGAAHVDIAAAEAGVADPDPAFDRDWAESIVQRATGRLMMEHEGVEARNRFDLLQGFLARNAEAGDYAGVGARLGMSEGAVKVAVHRLRQRLHDLLRQEVAETLATPSPQAIDDELAALAAALAGSL